MSIPAAAMVVPYDAYQVLAIECAKGRGLVLPGGKIEEGETPRDAAVRELFEETSLHIAGHAKYIWTYTDLKFHCHIFQCRVVSYDHMQESDEGKPVIVTWHDLIAKSEYKGAYEMLYDILFPDRT